MNEIYWLTRLDSVQGFFITALVIGAIFTLACWIINMVCTDLSNSNIAKSTNDSYAKKAKWNLRWSIPLLIFGISGVCFIPTTKDALLIWGVGGSIDYLKENPTAKQLPDRLINILDQWVDEISPKKENHAN